MNQPGWCECGHPNTGHMHDGNVYGGGDDVDTSCCTCECTEYRVKLEGDDSDEE